MGNGNVPDVAEAACLSSFDRVCSWDAVARICYWDKQAVIIVSMTIMLVSIVSWLYLWYIIVGITKKLIYTFIQLTNQHPQTNQNRPGPNPCPPPIIPNKLPIPPIPPIPLILNLPPNAFSLIDGALFIAWLNW